MSACLGRHFLPLAEARLPLIERSLWFGEGGEGDEEVMRRADA